ncbi:MAG: HlyD family type I secretion periplasmic adaptor subunit [Magnetococcales bacterium]|nr:HlyD family type I secretion periplasmic adaptor subunit [Magnetococcales bacterium]
MLFDLSGSPHRLRPLVEMGSQEEGGAMALVRKTWGLLLLSIIPVVAWSAVASVKEVAHVPGQVLPSGSVQAIQHLEGGIVSEVMVKESQLVAKDAVLLRLDDHQALPDRDQTEFRLASLEAQAIRLRSFAEGFKPDFSGIEDRFKNIVDAQTEIYQNQVKNLTANRSVLEAQIGQRQTELEQARGELSVAYKQLKLTSDMLEIRRELVEQKAISRVIYLETERANMTANGEVERLKKQINNLGEALSEAKRRMEKLKNDTRQEAISELGTVVNEMAQVREARTRTGDRVKRLEVRSPVRGVVQDVRFKTKGSVVQPGDVLMHVVPVEDHLQVEVRISTEDVGRVPTGEQVVVKLSSYEFSHFGTLPGRLVSVSPGTLVDPTQNWSYYKGLVTLDRDHVGYGRETHPILPGMLAQVDIPLGERTILQSLTQPVARAMREAFKER